MLEDLPCPPQKRCVIIEGIPKETLPFFRTLLLEWGFRVDVCGDELKLAKPAHWRASLSKPCEKMYLQPPLDLRSLWARVESQFHDTPRCHIRLREEHPAEFFIRGTRHLCRLSSLSGAGGRITLPHELLRGETGTLRFQLKHHTFEAPSQIIYAIPRWSNLLQPEADIGVAFHWKNRHSPRIIQDYIVARYLENVRTRLNIEDYEAGEALILLGREERKEECRHQKAPASVNPEAGLQARQTGHAPKAPTP